MRVELSLRVRLLLSISMLRFPAGIVVDCLFIRGFLRKLFCRLSLSSVFELARGI
mgnify:CR=1 FL=1